MPEVYAGYALLCFEEALLFCKEVSCCYKMARSSTAGEFFIQRHEREAEVVSEPERYARNVCTRDPAMMVVHTPTPTVRFSYVMALSLRDYAYAAAFAAAFRERRCAAMF